MNREDATTVEEVPMRLTVIDDPDLAETIQRQWNARAGNQIVARNMTAEELRGAQHLNTDIVIYPSALLGWLADRRWIGELPAEALSREDFRRDEIWALQRLHEPVWGGSIYAVSMGSPQFVLAYRKDLFEALDLKPPTTWAEYHALVEKLADREALGSFTPSPEASWAGAIEPLADGWAGLALLARAAPYARHRSQFSTLFDVRSMQPLIDGEPFRRALDEMSKAIELAGQRAGSTESADTLSGDGLSTTSVVEPLDPEAAWEALLAGQTAMAITWPTAGPRTEQTLQAGSLGFAELPGSPEAFSFRDRKWETRRTGDEPRVPLIGIAGRLGSVSSVARNPRAAANMLVWLAGPEISTAISAASSGTTLFRESHQQGSRNWIAASLSAEAAADYARVAAESQGRSWSLDALRIPGRERYLESLDRAVQAAVSGEQSASEALAEAARSWQTITEQLGVESQRMAYRRSLGLEGE